MLEQASLQVPEVKRSSCGDASQSRNGLVAPLEHLPFALDCKFDSFTMEVPQQGQGRKVREQVKESPLEMPLGEMHPHRALPRASICICSVLALSG